MFAQFVCYKTIQSSAKSFISHAEVPVKTSNVLIFYLCALFEKTANVVFSNCEFSHIFQHIWKVPSKMSSKHIDVVSCSSIFFTKLVGIISGIYSNSYQNIHFIDPNSL